MLPFPYIANQNVAQGPRASASPARVRDADSQAPESQTAFSLDPPCD